MISCYDFKSIVWLIDIFKDQTKDRLIMRDDPKQHHRKKIKAKEECLFLLAEQTEAFLLVLLSFAGARLCGRRRGRRQGGRQRLGAWGGSGGRRAVAAGRHLGLLARHGGGDVGDPCVHLLLQDEKSTQVGSEAAIIPPALPSLLSHQRS